MNKDKIKQLFILNKELETIQERKGTIIKEQKYEEAAELRDKEKATLNKVDEVIDLDKEKFDSDDILFRVQCDLREVIKFIEEDDTNLTPALLRKLTNDSKESIDRERESRSYMMELKEKLSQFEWIHVKDEHPELSYEGKSEAAEWEFSEEVMVLYLKADGEYGVALARYVEEWVSLNNRQCSFQLVEDIRDSISEDGKAEARPFSKLKEFNNLKGWKDVPGLAVKGWMPIPEKKLTKKKFRKKHF